MTPDPNLSIACFSQQRRRANPQTTRGARERSRSVPAIQSQRASQPIQAH